MPIHDTGVWVDDSGEVVFEQPEGRSTQIIAKGGEISGAARTRLEQLGVTLDEETGETVVADEQPTEDDLTVTTDSVKHAAPRKRAAKKSS